MRRLPDRRPPQPWGGATAARDQRKAGTYCLRCGETYDLTAWGTVCQSPRCSFERCLANRYRLADLPDLKRRVLRHAIS